MTSWKVAAAKARFSELIERALQEGPPEITRHGKRTAVVVSAAEWDRRAQRKGGLVEFLERSPLKDSPTIERPQDPSLSRRGRDAARASAARSPRGW